jgi:hypothetical protein
VFKSIKLVFSVYIVNQCLTKAVHQEIQLCVCTECLQTRYALEAPEINALEASGNVGTGDLQATLPLRPTKFMYTRGIIKVSTGGRHKWGINGGTGCVFGGGPLRAHLHSCSTHPSVPLVGTPFLWSRHSLGSTQCPLRGPLWPYSEHF